jgi:hypothetical protein
VKHGLIEQGLTAFSGKGKEGPGLLVVSRKTETHKQLPFNLRIRRFILIQLLQESGRGVPLPYFRIGAGKLPDDRYIMGILLKALL